MCVGEERLCSHVCVTQGKEEARAQLAVNKLFFMFTVLRLKNWSQLLTSAPPKS